MRALCAAGVALPWNGDASCPPRSTGWSSVGITSYYLGTATQAATLGRTLTRTGAVAGRAALVAGMGPSWGRVTVYYNGTAVKTLSLASTTYRTRVVIALPALTRSTTVVIRTLDNKTVRLDGLLLARA